MAPSMNRRQFNVLAGKCAATAATSRLSVASVPPVKPITGSWFEFQHHATVEGVDWNPALAQFTADQWAAKTAEMADAGLKYLVLMATAVYYRAFFKTDIYP